MILGDDSKTLCRTGLSFEDVCPLDGKRWTESMCRELRCSLDARLVYQAEKRTVSYRWWSISLNDHQYPKIVPTIIAQFPHDGLRTLPLYAFVCESLWAGRSSIVLGRRRASMSPKFKADFWDGHVKHRAEIGLVWICLMYPMTSQYII